MEKPKLKILELTNYSAGICGVWQRVKQESLELFKRGHEVRIFTSNATKGSDEIAAQIDRIQDIEINRFSFKKLGGESFMNWDFKKKALEFKPDIIIAHSYRHPHTLKALKVRKKLNQQGKKCKVFLVTHAPFIEGDITRNFFSKFLVKLYDKFVGPRTINKFDKVINITKWELPYLKKLGLKKEKSVYIPNGIPEEFFKIRIRKGKGLLFLGRISPIKDLEVLIRAMKGTNFKLDIIGPSEKDYKNELIELADSLGAHNIQFKPPVYDLKDKILLIDKYEAFVLPSRREAMPQALIEAMSRGRIIISSDNPGSREIINKKNGFLFKVGSSEKLAEILKKVKKLSVKNKHALEEQAKKTSEKFKLTRLVDDLEALF